MSAPPVTPVTPDRGTRWGVVAVALLLLALLMSAGGAWGLTRAHTLRDTPAAQNRALVDADATSRVEGEVATALGRVLSYDYTRPDQTSASAQQFLTGQARKQYAVLFKALQEKAPGQQLVLTAKVSVLGVTSLSADRARLLVFLDQGSTRATDQSSQVAAAQLRIDAQRIKGVWMISGLDPI